jgi:hypothetical protein
MRTPTLTLLLLAAILGGAAVVVSAQEAVWTRRDLWYTGLPEGEDPFRSWVPVPHDRYFPVDLEASARAEALLRDVPFTLLSPSAVSQFARAARSPGAGHQPYLLRGVVLNESAGRFSLYSSRGRLLVSHDSLGHHPVPMVRRPLVAYPPEAPLKVFVVCGMDD